MNVLQFAFLRTLSENPTQDAYQIAVSVLIIVLSVVLLFLLFRNITKEFKKSRKDKQAMKQDGKGKSNEKLPTVINELVSDKKGVSSLLGEIDYWIVHADEGSIAVLFYMDLDGFKFISEKYGQKETDKVITEIEKRLKKHAPKGSICGHLEEDTFVYFMTGDVNGDMIKETGTSILNLVSEPLKAIPEEITTSIGVVLFPYDGIDSTQLVKNAEIALYVSKREGKNRYHLYSQDMLDKEQFNIDYYQEIKRSISNDEFILYYQPIVDIKTGRIIGLESLLRWNHPTMGVLPPSKFLNVMDLTGDIVWFGSWGFEKIVKQYTLWKDRFRFRDIFISTNLSPKQLIVEGLAKTFFNTVKKYELQTEMFCLEIIDYYTVIKNPIAVTNLDEFRKFGFRIAIDDLGDDYKIIDDIMDIKAQIVKINRENTLKVMNDFEDIDKIVRTIKVSLQQEKVVIAEGIENETMIRKMASYDIRFMQGFYFSVPKAEGEIGRMLENSPWNMDTFAEFSK